MRNIMKFSLTNRRRIHMIQLLKHIKLRFDGVMRMRGIGRWRSETSKCRSRLARYCVGAGIDIGAGGDPIVPTAVIVDLHNLIL